jgi:hypothetical protein
MHEMPANKRATEGTAARDAGAKDTIRAEQKQEEENAGVPICTSFAE